MSWLKIFHSIAGNSWRLQATQMAEKGKCGEGEGQRGTNQTKTLVFHIVLPRRVSYGDVSAGTVHMAHGLPHRSLSSRGG